MSSIIDRRKNTRGKSSGNRQKFLKRVSGQIKKALPDVISDQGIKEISSGGKVKVPIKGINEPTFHPDFESGKKDYVKPGNDRYMEGDKIPRPEKRKGGGGRKGSNDPNVQEDEFHVILSREEFLKYFFDDLELPDMIKKYLESLINFKNKRAGFVKDSNPSRLNVKKSFKESLSRRLGIKASLKNQLKELKEELKNSTLERKKEIEEEIEKIKKKLKTIPFLDDIDLRYNHFEQIPIPTTSAVMFCIMDVSGSMGLHEKDIAKRFFTLLYIFLTKSYENIDLVFIRHHTEAKEVSEEEFFNSRETGGTVVLPSLELMQRIAKDRYSDGKWNMYCCQASDGDTWSLDDAIDCADILKKKILKDIQYMAYLEINGRGSDSELWESYEEELKDFPNFAMRKVFNVNEIWPCFKDLFKKRTKAEV